MQYIGLLDYVILPIVVCLIYLVARQTRDRNYRPGHPWRRYYLAGLSLKIVGAVLNGMLHYYYYGGGDTFNFFYHSHIINSSLNDSVIYWFNLLFRIPDFHDLDYYKYTSQMYWYDDVPSYTVAAIAAVLSLPVFGTYLPTAVLFAFISYSGTWAMFRTFAGLYPRLTKQVAVATLFIPTTILWGSAVYKDTICMFGLGWLTYGVFRFLVQKDFSLKNIVLATVSFILIALVKIYILIAFVPALGMWILFNYTQRIANQSSRLAIKLLVFALVIGASLLLMAKLSDTLGGYSLENIAYKAEETRAWIAYSSETQDGSGYSLGNISAESGIGGMLVKFPQAVNVSLFRPYLWEVRKPIMLLAAFESLLFLIFTLRVLFSVGLKKFWQTINQDATVQFCLIFSVIFAFAVGITTYNFGSLSRYKIPCLPFYTLALIIIYYKHNPPQKKILPPFF